MHILTGAAGDGEAIGFVLHISPEQVIGRPERIDFQVQKGITIAAANVLETPADGIHGLHQHAFFVPVAPDKLEKARLIDLVDQNLVARGDAEFVLREAASTTRRMYGS